MTARAKKRSEVMNFELVPWIFVRKFMKFIGVEIYDFN